MQPTLVFLYSKIIHSNFRSVQHGYVPLPKSVHQERINSNTEIFDFEISDEDMKTLDSFDEYFVTEWDPTRYK